MKLEITTTPEKVEKANYVLAQAIMVLKDRDDIRKFYGLTEKDLEKVESFRNQMLSAFLNF